jgi:hypothetical protein
MNRVPSGNFQIWETETFSDARGKLGSINIESLPFISRRFFWLFDIPVGETRGNHGHFKSNQFVCCLSGFITIEVFPPAMASTLIELRAGESIFIPVRHWIRIAFHETASVCGVFADTEYDPTDVFDEPIA